MKKIKGISILLVFINFFYPFHLFGQEIRSVDKIQKVQTTFNFMPMGNSITKGYTGSPSHFGYRELLFNKLVASFSSSYTIHFVGEIDWKASSGSLNSSDYWTEAYQGWETTNIINVINGTEPSPPGKTLGTGDLFPTRVPTDMVFLHIGTNDIEFESSRTPADIANNVDTILGNIQSQDNSIVVILARVILDVNDNKGVNGPFAIRTKDYNGNLITTAVNRIVNNDDKLIVVNMQDALNYPDSLQTYTDSIATSDLYFDGSSILHPKQSGYDKMAIVWYNAVSNYFNGMPTLIAPVENAVNVYTPVTLAWGITQNMTNFRVEVSSDGTFNSATNIYDNLSTPTSNRYVTLNNSNTINGGFVPYHTYYWRVTDNNTLTTSDTWTFTTGTPLYVKVFLQGPYNITNHNMDANLTSLSDFPKTQPYNASTWKYNGQESVLTIPSGVVDWVLVQLRTGTAANTTVAQRAGFLLQDGSIVDLDGTTPINFNVDPTNSYYIVVKHRNHLAVMSSSAVSPSSYSSSTPFTFDNTDVYGGATSLDDLSDGNYGMWAGDVNGNGTVNYAINSDRTALLNDLGNNLISTKNGYYNSDVNMNGTVNYGISSDRTMILNVLGNSLIATKSTQVP